MERDERLVRAVALHASAAGRERDARTLSTAERLERDALLRALRAEDPKRYTQAALAAELGCSPELIALIERGHPGRRTAKGA